MDLEVYSTLQTYLPGMMLGGLQSSTITKGSHGGHQVKMAGE